MPRKLSAFTFSPSGVIAGGRLTVYHDLPRFPDRPAPCKETYTVLGLDFAYGLEDGDFDAGVLLDARGKQLLTIVGHWGEAFAEVLWPILQWYQPFVVGERQVGLPTLRAIYDGRPEIKRPGYTWLYFNRDMADRGRKRRDALGHHAFAGDLIIPELRKAIAPRDSSGKLLAPKIEIYDEEILSQLQKFQFMPKSRSAVAEDEELRDHERTWGAPPGEHDDLVMALGYAWAGIAWLPHFEKPPEVFKPGTMGAMFGTPSSIAAEAKSRRPSPFGPGR